MKEKNQKYKKRIYFALYILFIIGVMVCASSFVSAVTLFNDTHGVSLANLNEAAPACYGTQVMFNASLQVYYAVAPAQSTMTRAYIFNASYDIIARSHESVGDRIMVFNSTNRPTMEIGKVYFIVSDADGSNWANKYSGASALPKYGSYTNFSARTGTGTNDPCSSYPTLHPVFTESINTWDAFTVFIVTPATATKSLSLLTPADSTRANLRTQDYTFNAAWDGAVAGIQNASLYVDGIRVASNTTPINNNSTSSFNYKYTGSLGDGSFVDRWSIEVYDTQGFRNITANNTLNIIQAPIIQLYSPQNNSILSSPTTDLFYNASVVTTGTTTQLINISLYIDGEYNQSNTTAKNNYLNNSFTGINFREGTHYWNIKVVGQSATYSTLLPTGLNQNSSSNFTILVESQLPTSESDIENKIVLNRENQASARNSLTGWINVSDANLYSVIINDTTTGTIANISNITKGSYNYSLSLNLTNYKAGRHIIYVTMLDGAENQIVNKIMVNYSWYHVKFIDTNSSKSSYLEKGAFKNNLYINKTTGFDTNVTFYYNDSISRPLAVNSTGYDIYNSSVENYRVYSNVTNITYGWYITVSNGSKTSTFNVSYNSSIYEFFLTNCSDGMARGAINFSVYDESTSITSDDPLNNYTFIGTFKISTKLNPTFQKNYSWGYLVNETYNGICLYPNTTEQFDLVYQVNFEKSGYTSKLLTELAGYANYTLQLVKVYLVPSTSTTTVTTTVIDEIDNKLTGYIVEVWKYNLFTDSYSVLDTQIVDSEGQCNFDLDVGNNKEYKFIVKNTVGVEVYTQPKQKLIQTDYTFIVVLGEIKEMTTVKLSNLDIKLRAFRGTKQFTLKWSNIETDASRIRFTVYNMTNNTISSVLYNITSTSASGEDSYTVSHPLTNESGYYMASVFVTSLDDSKEYLYKSVTMEFREEYSLFGTEALFAAFLIIGTLAMMGMQHGQEISAFLAIFGFIISIKMGFLILGMSSLMSLIIAFVVYMVKARAR